jgi:hypothetical protein
MENTENENLSLRDLLNEKGIKLFEEEMKHRKETFEKTGALPAIPKSPCLSIKPPDPNCYCIYWSFQKRWICM